MTLKTFKEIAEQYQDQLYLGTKAQNDPALQALIYKWFQYREVCDPNPEKFLNFFQRTLDENYDKYLEQLRLEPGKARYDWLITSYQERKKENERNLKNKITRKGDKTNNESSKSNPGTTRTEAYTGEDTNNFSGLVERVNGNVKSTESGNDVRTLTPRVKDISTLGAHTDNLSVKTLNKQTITDSQSGEDISQDWNKDSRTNKRADKVLPLDIQGVNPSVETLAPDIPNNPDPNSEEQLDYQNMDAKGIDLQWGNATSQAEEDSKGLNYKYGKMIKGTQNVRSFSGEADENNSENIYGQAVNTVEHEGEDQDNIAYGHVIDTGYDNLEREADTENKLKYGKTITSSVSGEDKSSKENNEHFENELEGEQTGIIGDYEIITGRIGDKEISQILSNAISFIKSTCAWSNFMYKQLNTVFFGIYDV